MTGLRVAGIPVDLRADGVVIAGTPATLPDSGLPINDVLAQAGVKIERLPDVRNVTADGQIAEIRVGGIRFTFTQPNAEVTLIVTIGDLVARSRARRPAGRPAGAAAEHLAGEPADRRRGHRAAARAVLPDVAVAARRRTRRASCRPDGAGRRWRLDRDRRARGVRRAVVVARPPRLPGRGASLDHRRKHMLERIKQVDRRQALAWLLIVAGAVAGLIGWIGVSGRDVEALQLPFLASGGIAALILTAVGAALLISSDVRADRERAGRLEAEVLELQDMVRELSERLDGGSRSATVVDAPVAQVAPPARRTRRARAGRARRLRARRRSACASSARRR